MSKLSDEPWEEVSLDFIGLFTSSECVLVVDDYLRYPEIEIVYLPSARSTIIKYTFFSLRIPLNLKTDNIPQFF